MFMHHVAIMNKSWKLIPKIISGEKAIESRWYQTKRTPWNTAKAGDTIYFKNAGELIIAKAEIEKVIQYEIKDVKDIQKIIKQYGKGICLVNTKPETWGKLPKYCILLFLKNPSYFKKPFQINKKGFGIGAAWITVPNILQIELK